MSKFARITVAMSLAVAFAGAAHAGDPASLLGEDSGSFWLSQQYAATASDAGPASATPIAGIDAAAMYGEDSGSFLLAANLGDSARTRAEVNAEILQARASGELDAFYGEDSGAEVMARRAIAPSVRYAGPNVGDDEAAPAHDAA